MTSHISATDVQFASATELVAAIGKRQVSPVELVAAALHRIEELNPELNAFLAVDADQAMAAARDAERAMTTGAALGQLHGLPVAVKDLEATRGLATSYGALAFRDDVPDSDSAVVARLRRAGAIIVGKTNTPLFGLLGEVRNRLGDDARNPWDTTRTTGGSSGGSAAAVAAGITALATGTDSAGSINCPAGMCGVYGIKPTHGRVPMVPDSGDALLFNDAGPLTRTVADAALMLSVLAGHDPRDPVSLRATPADYRVAADSRLPSGIRVAWSRDLGHFAVDPEVADIAERAARRFAEFCTEPVLATPAVPNPWEIYSPLYLTDARVALEEFLRDHPDELFDESTAELASLPPLSAEEYVRTYHRLLRFRATMAEFFDTYQLLLTPTTAVAAFPCGEPPHVIDGREVMVGWRGFMPFQITWNMTGQPVASVPAGLTRDGLPVGLQIIGPLGREDLVLAASAAFEQAHPWAHHVPPVAA